jgi:hypothetical protein
MRGAATVVLLVSVALAPAALRAADDGGKAAARAKVQEGAALFERGDFAGALACFDDAIKKFPNAVIQFNRAQALRGLGRDVEAAEALETFLAEARTVSAEKRGEAEGDLAEIRRGLGILTIVCDVDGAEVLVDGKAVGTTPLAKPVRVKAGTRELTIRKQGSPAVKRSVEVAGREERKVDVALAPAPPPPPVVVKKIEGPGGTISGGGAGGHGTTGGAPQSELSHAGRLGLSVRGDMKVVDTRGLVLVPGLTYGVAERVEIGAGALVGFYKGAEAEARLFLALGAWKPMLTLGVPLFFVGGAQLGVQPGAGLLVDIGAHVAIAAEATAAYFPFAPSDLRKLVFVPSLGTQIRL